MSKPQQVEDQPEPQQPEQEQERQQEEHQPQQQQLQPQQPILFRQDSEIIPIPPEYEPTVTFINHTQRPCRDSSRIY